MVTTVCYGEEKVWESRKEAKEFFFEGMVACEGCEAERYTKIYTELEMGLDYCTDDPEKIGKCDIRELFDLDDEQLAIRMGIE